MPGACRGCGKALVGTDRVAVIAGRVMGDELVDLYYRCVACKRFSVRSIRDSFTGGEHSTWAGPYDGERVAAKLATIRRCKEPANERCRCQAHRSYFGSVLD